MAERKRIGIVFDDFGGLWTGGTYYILNLITAMKLLPEESMPELVIFSNDEKEYQMIESTGYPFLKRSYELEVFKRFPSYNIIEKALNKVYRVLFKRNLIEKRPQTKDLQFLFPILDPLFFRLPGLDHFHKYFLDLIPKVYWIPDFQEHYLPQFFNQVDIDYRKKFQREISEKESLIVFSSQDVQNDFYTFYPNTKAKTFVLNFAVTHPDYNVISWDQVKEKYKLDKPYFFSPNQFWKHKNQIVLLEAINKLKKEGVDFIVAFSGKETDLRNPDYYNYLKQYIKDNELEEQVRFLGFIDRLDQLQIMKNAMAVVQPSLFEGWSTVVEDAKAMNQYVVLSNLKVHQEQLETNCTFFDPKNATELASILKEIRANPPQIIEKAYKQNQLKFANELVKLLTYVD